MGSILKGRILLDLNLFCETKKLFLRQLDNSTVSEEHVYCTFQNVILKMVEDLIFTIASFSFAYLFEPTVDSTRTEAFLSELSCPEPES